MLRKITETVIGPMVVALGFSLLLAGCNASKLQDDLQLGLGFARAVSCATAGQGGDAAQRLELALKKGDAWVNTTGEIRAVSSEVCSGLGGNPTSLTR